MDWNKGAIYWLSIFAIFATVLFLRLLFLSEVGLDNDGYGTLRNVEHILETGKPQYVDELSNYKDSRPFPPLYYYVLAFFGLFLPTLTVVKIIPAIFASSTVILVYLISRKLVKNEQVSLMLALFSGFIPGYFAGVLNDGSIHSFFLPLFLLTLYFLIDVNETKKSTITIVLISLLTLTHPLSFILVGAIVINFLLIKLLSQKIKNYEVELGLFSLFLVFWFSFLIYKKALFVHGLRIFWGNTPSQIITDYFNEFALSDLILWTGFLTLIFGMYSAYHVLFVYKRRNFFLLVSTGILLAILLISRILPLKIGLIYLSFTLLLLSSLGFKLLYTQLSKTKFRKIRSLVFVAILIAFILTSFLQTLDRAAAVEQVDEEDIFAYQWIDSNSRNDVIIITPIDEAEVAKYYSNRQVVMDKNFLLVNNPNQLYEDVITVYTTSLQVDPVRILENKEVNFIVVTKDVLSETGDLKYVDDLSCITREYDGGTIVYKVNCEIQ